MHLETFDQHKIWSRDSWLEDKGSPGAFSVGLWKEIIKEANWVSEKWKFKIGTCTRIRFGTDH